MVVADEIQALLLIHDRLSAWERPFVRDMAKRLEQRGSLTTKQLMTIGRICDRHRISTVPNQAAPGCRGRSKIRPPGRHGSRASNADLGMIRYAARLCLRGIFSSPVAQPAAAPVA